MHHKNHSCCHTSKAALEKALTYCADHGLRFTDARRQVFSILWRSKKALSAKEIMEQLGNQQPPITYRALDFLISNNLAHHLASVNAYTACCHIGEEHVGVLKICKECHEVEEVDAQLTALDNLADDTQFSVERTYVEVTGRCTKCSS